MYTNVCPRVQVCETLSLRTHCPPQRRKGRGTSPHRPRSTSGASPYVTCDLGWTRYETGGFKIGGSGQNLRSVPGPRLRLTHVTTRLGKIRRNPVSHSSATSSAQSTKGQSLDTPVTGDSVGEPFSRFISYFPPPPDLRTLSLPDYR